MSSSFVGNGRFDGEITYVQDGAGVGERLVVLRRDGFFHYRVEWIERDDGDGNGRIAIIAITRRCMGPWTTQ